MGRGKKVRKKKGDDGNESGTIFEMARARLNIYIYIYILRMARTPANVLLPSRSSDTTNEVLPTFPARREEGGRRRKMGDYILSMMQLAKSAFTALDTHLSHTAATV